MRPSYCGRDNNNANKSRSAYGAMPHYLTDNSFHPSSALHRANHSLRSYVVSRQSRSPSYQDQEQESGSGQTRRRIPVACARCRKRKIRCSGDPGNGSGCRNCRTAGADINACQFHRVNSIEFPMPLQYDMSQAGLPVRDVSHQYNNYLSPHGTSKEKDHIASTDEKSSLLSSSVSSQRLAYQPDLSNFHVEGRCANQYGSAANQDTARNIITNTHSRNMDNSRNWHSQLLHGQMSDVFGPDQSTAEMYSRNSYQYSQNQEQVPRQQMIRTDSVTSLGIAALDPCMPPVLVDRQLPIPTGGRIVGSTAMSELTPNHSSILSSHGLNGMNTEHNTVYGKATSTWANKNGINHPLCNSPGSMLSNELRNPSTITEGETCDNSGLSPMSCVSPQCTPEPYRSPSAHPVTTGINNPASLAGRDFPHRANTMPSKHGIPPSLYSFSSDYPRQEPCYESSFEGSLGNGQKCTPLY